MLRRFSNQEEFTREHNSFFTYFVDLHDNPYRTQPVFKAFQEAHPKLEETLTGRVTKIYARSERIRERVGGVEGLLQSIAYLERHRNTPECQSTGWQAYKAMRALVEKRPKLNPDPTRMDALLR